jgi:hypothetical protein
MAPLSTAFHGNYIPEIYSPKLIRKFHQKLFINQITNSDYEGEIKNHGDVVHIRQIPTIAVRDFAPRTDLQIDDIDAPDVVDLNIDKGLYYAFKSDALEEHQSDVAYVNKATEEGSTTIKETLEARFIAAMAAEGAAANRGATAGAKSASYNIGSEEAPLSITKDNALDTIIDFGSILDEQNVPEDQRYVILPPIFLNRIKKSEIKEVYVTGDKTSSLRTGNVGMIDRFHVFQSNMFVGNDGKWFPFFGHKYAIAFPTQLVKNEVTPITNRFGNAHKGLCVYGYQVIKPEALGVACVKFA